MSRVWARGRRLTCRRTVSGLSSSSRGYFTLISFYLLFFVDLLILSVNQLTDALTGLERILTTPIPFSYVFVQAYFPVSILMWCFLQVLDPPVVGDDHLQPRAAVPDLSDSAVVDDPCEWDCVLHILWVPCCW